MWPSTLDDLLDCIAIEVVGQQRPPLIHASMQQAVTGAAAHPSPGLHPHRRRRTAAVVAHPCQQQQAAATAHPLG
jgi:hypothetical protein